MEEPKSIHYLLGQIQAKQEIMHAELRNLRTDINDYKKFKNRVIGALAIVGAFLTYIFNPFKGGG